MYVRNVPLLNTLSTPKQLHDSWKFCDLCIHLLDLLSILLERIICFLNIYTIKLKENKTCSFQ